MSLHLVERVQQYLGDKCGQVVPRKQIKSATGIESKALTRTMRELARRGVVKEGVSLQSNANERVYVVVDPGPALVSA